jgi:hypothetical protein
MITSLLSWLLVLPAAAAVAAGPQAMQKRRANGRDVHVDPWQDLRQALDVMQTSYFALWRGAWPTAIDWTAAVMNTHIAASLAALSKALDAGTGAADARHHVENELNRYFAQAAAYYFGEDTFAIRNEAFDDMLWVVLAWLEHLRFLRLHSRLHGHEPWHGVQYIPAFAHRAHVFYDLASRGWDETLCGGGMLWNPALEPYKNSVTNQLWISASVGMFLHFPGILRLRVSQHVRRLVLTWCR